MRNVRNAILAVLTLFILMAGPVLAHADEMDAGPASSDAAVTTAPSASPTAGVPDPAKDPGGFFKTLYEMGKAGEWFPVFAIVLIGVVELTRRKFILDKLKFLKNPWVARGQVAVLAMAGAIFTAKGAGKPVLPILAMAAVHAVAAMFGWQLVKPDKAKV